MRRGTRHAASCSRVFARYDLECPRCRELAAGAQPREGWGRSAAERREQEQRDAAAIRAHFAPGGPHDRGVCGPVCTAFDW
jgi:hypothetical protein